MRSSLLLSFQSLSVKYSKLGKKIRHSIERGDFWRYTNGKRARLIRRLERLRRRLETLRTELKLGAAGVALSLMLSSHDTNAQSSTITTLGPYVINPAKNPLPGPAFRRENNATVAYADLDSDGDLDAVTSGDVHYLHYYKNVGSKTQPVFQEQETYPMFDAVNLQGSYGDPARVTFADIDDDGDLDMLVGQAYTDNSPSIPDYLAFFRNDGTPTEPHFTLPLEQDPFRDIQLISGGWPTFADVDKDGDQDLVVGGYHFDADSDSYGWVQYFLNEKVGKTPGVDPVFTPVTGTNNPFRVAANEATGTVAPALADMDGDGDLDFIYATDLDLISYRRNDNGTFVAATGAWSYNAANPGSSTGNPFELQAITTLGLKGYKGISMADLDGDGDADLTLSINIADTGPDQQNYVFVQNTGHGTMQPKFGLESPLGGLDLGSRASVSFVDVDNDGDLDILASGISYLGTACQNGCETYTNFLAHLTFINDGGRFTQLPINQDPIGTLPNLPTNGKMSIVDVDDDGDFDIVIASFTYVGYSEVALIDYYRNDSGVYNRQDPQTSPFAFILAGNFQSSRVDFGDFDHDGLKDLLLCQAGHRLAFYKNTGVIGAPVYTEVPTWGSESHSTAYSPFDTKIVDLDNDGDLDIIAGKYRNFWFYENIGTDKVPNFLEYRDGVLYQQDPTSPSNPFASISSLSGTPAPALMDVDGDGDKDLLFGDDSGTFTFVENQNPAPEVTQTRTQFELPLALSVIIDKDLTLSDSDGDEFVRALVQIVPFEVGKELLELTGTHPKIAAAWDAQKGILTLTPKSGLTALAADFQAALRAVQYTPIVTSPPNQGRMSSQPAGRTISKTISLQAFDSDFTATAASKSTYSLTHANQPPVVAPGAFNVAFVGTPINLPAAITVTDPDDAIIASATIQISPVFSGEDVLTFSPKGTITGTYNAATATLTLTGSGTLTEFQDVIRSVKYNNSKGSSANTAIRTISIKVNDGENDSNVATGQLSVTPPTPPTLSGVANVFYTSGALTINSLITINDPDTTKMQGATVAITSGFDPSQDVLLFTDQNSIVGSYNTASGVLTLTGASSTSNYQTALRSVQYRNSSSTPSTTPRGITFSVTDGSPSVSLSGTVIVVNRPPVIQTEEKKTAAGGNIALVLTDLISDPDGNLDLSTLSITSKQGARLISNGGVITIDYSSVPTFKGTDEIIITACDAAGRCETATVLVEVGAEPVVYSGMSPNGDGVNDWFYIQFVEPGTQVGIYNRWGDAVFETNDYDNNEPSKRFEGKNKAGTDVVSGSYYYKIKFPDGRVKTGYIMLSR